MKSKYDDMLDLPHHVSTKYKQMSMEDRAAQFAPFAALTGYGDIIDETGRLTGRRIELDEDQKQFIENELQKLREEVENRTGRANGNALPEITVTYFLSDAKKEGGAYVEKRGTVKKIDEMERTLLFCDGMSVRIDDLLEIYCID